MPAAKNFNEIRNLYRGKLAKHYANTEVDAICSLAAEYILKWTNTDQFLKKDDPLEPRDINELLNILDRLEKDEPIQHILGETEFYSLRFEVNKHVLIPRQETEMLVDSIIKDNTGNKIRILDIGTGSGCIAISLKHNLPMAEVTAIDISTEALEIARRNAERNNAEIEFIHANILSGERDFGAFDLIVSNPPYVREMEKSQMHANVVKFDPGLALYVPDDNALIFYEVIADFASKSLTNDGIIWLEINEALAEETCLVFHKKGFIKTLVIKDLENKDRIIKAER
jgi:release factor glutamine methyltransferase